MECSEAKQRSVKSILEDRHGTRVCRVRDVLGIIFVLASLAGGILAFNTQAEFLLKAAKAIRDMGALGHLMFFLLHMWVGLPIGYNWSAIVTLVGFAYGWYGVIHNTLFSMIAVVLTHYGLGYCMQPYMKRRMERLGKRKRLYLLAVSKVIESNRGGFLMLIVLRMQPVQTFGLTNAFLSTFPSITMRKLLASSFLGMEHSVIMLTSIGILVRDVGSLGEAADSDHGRMNLFITAGISAVTIVICLIFARYLVVHMLPKMIEDDVMVDVGEISVDESANSVGKSDENTTETAAATTTCTDDIHVQEV